MEYREDRADSKKYKEEYLDGIEKLISRRQEESEKKRAEYIKDVFAEPEKYREDLRKMLGWPLTENGVKAPPAADATFLSEEDGHRIYRMRIQVQGELTLTGLYFESTVPGARPLVVALHGGLGTPELISGFLGDTSNYNGMLARVKKYGVDVFAPQLLLWDKKKYAVDYDRADIDEKLKSVGSSVTAVELYAIMRAIDYFEKEKKITSFGMVGLSYGGFYTLRTAALDPRIKSAISCSFFGDGRSAFSGDRSWFGSAGKFDNAEIAALIYPRRLCIEVGEKDELFDIAGARRSFNRLKEICRPVGTDWVDYIEFDGAHEFCRDDGPIEKMINDLYL